MNVNIISDRAVSPNLAARDEGTCCAYPLSALLNDGTVAVVYRSGATTHSHDGVLMIQTSADHGASWDEPRVVFDGTVLDPSQTAVTGGLVQTPNGALLAVFGVVEGLEPGVYMFSDEGLPLRREILISRSEDAGQTWSAAEPFATPGIPRAGIVSSPFLSAAGEVCVLLEFQNSAGAQCTAMMFSGDDGETFGDPVVVAEDPLGKLSLCDARATVLPDERILVLLWTFRQEDEQTIEVHRTFSPDHGRTWTTPQSIGMVGQITPPLALPSGEVIALSNVRIPPEGIQLWHSPDGGENWDSERRVQMWDLAEGRMLGKEVGPAQPAGSGAPVWDELQRFSFGTPDLGRLGDGTILMTYYATVDSIIHVRACRFSIG